MASLAVFDFDRTIVQEDSDATIINRLREKQPPPEWEASNHDWTPYMNEVFEHAHSAGLSEAELLACVAGMRPSRGAAALLAALPPAGWDVLLLTDANSVFVSHWLRAHGLEQYVTCVITNRASFSGGRLHMEPCMHQESCPRCPANLCKSLALAQWCAQRRYSRLVYAGDGRNDYCPATNLPPHAIVFPRKGYPMDELIKKTLATDNPEVVAKVVPWEDCYTILQELCLDKAPVIPV